VSNSAALTTPPAERQAALIVAQRSKMARSAHAYMRGNTVRFYAWLRQRGRHAAPSGPPVWICGDCHVGNLGPVADAEGRIDVQIRDLDQTVIGNPAHDLIRMALSLATAARGSDLPGVTTAYMLEHLMEGYEKAMSARSGKAAVAGEKPEAIRLVVRKAMARTWKHLARERLEDIKPNIPLNDRFWPLSKVEKKAINDLFESQQVRRLVTSLKSRKDAARVRVLDAAYWMKGCSSLGRMRFAVLLGVGKASKSDDFCLIDIKEATAAVAPRSPGAHMPRDNAVRVVTGARQLAPNLGERMMASRFMNKPVFIRELLPQDLKLEIDQLTREEAVHTAQYLAGVVGLAHASQMTRSARKAWRAMLRRDRSKRLDAPSWLWSSVVDLLADHELAYLEHCRAFVLAEAHA
jgi:uncharacterized protein (DUF2252 family)